MHPCAVGAVAHGLLVHGTAGDTADHRAQCAGRVARTPAADLAADHCAHQATDHRGGGACILNPETGEMLDMQNMQEDVVDMTSNENGWASLTRRDGSDIYLNSKMAIKVFAAPGGRIYLKMQDGVIKWKDEFQRTLRWAYPEVNIEGDRIELGVASLGAPIRGPSSYGACGRCMQRPYLIRAQNLFCS